MRYDIPEPSLTPPEDRRPVVAECIVCGEPIRENDEAYDIPGCGWVCAHCIEDSHVLEVPLD